MKGPFQYDNIVNKYIVLRFELFRNGAIEEEMNFTCNIE